MWHEYKMLSNDHEKTFPGSLMFLPHFDFRCTPVGCKEKGKMLSIDFAFWDYQNKTWPDMT